jgi:hypothetical protein
VVFLIFDRSADLVDSCTSTGVTQSCVVIVGHPAQYPTVSCFLKSLAPDNGFLVWRSETEIRVQLYG